MPGRRARRARSSTKELDRLLEEALEPSRISEDDRIMLERMSKEREAGQTGALFYIAEHLSKYLANPPRLLTNFLSQMNLKPEDCIGKSRTYFRNSMSAEIVKMLMTVLFHVMDESDRARVRAIELPVQQGFQHKQSRRKAITKTNVSEENHQFEIILKALLPQYDEKTRIPKCPQVVVRCVDELRAASTDQVKVRLVDRCAFVLDIRYKVRDPRGAELLVLFPASQDYTYGPERSSKDVAKTLRNRTVILKVFDSTHITNQQYTFAYDDILGSYMKIRCIYPFQENFSNIPRVPDRHLLYKEGKGAFDRFLSSYVHEWERVGPLKDEDASALVHDFPDLIPTMRRAAFKVSNLFITGVGRRDCDRGFNQFFQDDVDPQPLKWMVVGLGAVTNYKRKKQKSHVQLNYDSLKESTHTCPKQDVMIPLFAEFVNGTVKSMADFSQTDRDYKEGDHRMNMDKRASDSAFCDSKDAPSPDKETRPDETAPKHRKPRRPRPAPTRSSARLQAAATAPRSQQADKSPADSTEDAEEEDDDDEPSDSDEPVIAGGTRSRQF